MGHRSSRRNHGNDEPSYDSFLDIVANLVGILVILVMVIGVRARGAFDESRDETTQASVANEKTPSAAQAVQLPDTESAAATVTSLTKSVHQISMEAKQTEGLASVRRQERDKLQVILAASRRKLDEAREQLDDKSQDQFDLSKSLDTAESELEQLQAERSAIENSEKSPQELRHLPTPMAKTVFGTEEHFRLSGGRIVRVPLEELSRRLKREAPHKVWRLKESPSFSETIGPLDGFHLKYTLSRNKYAERSQSGTTIRSVAELTRFVLVPITEQMGEPVERALQPGSKFYSYLNRLNPNETVVTVWTYPDSYEDFRQLKETLFDAGFLTAARPLPQGYPIAGSPNGSRSSSQ